MYILRPSYVTEHFYSRNT